MIIARGTKRPVAGIVNAEGKDGRQQAGRGHGRKNASHVLRGTSRPTVRVSQSYDRKERKTSNKVEHQGGRSASFGRSSVDERDETGDTVSQRCY